MKIPIILQARTGSTRLPGKALKTVAGKPLLYRVIETLQGAAEGFVVLALPENPDCDPLCRIAGEMNVPWIRGPEEDVLQRFVLAAEAHPAPVYIRATGDNPLVDPGSIRRLVTYLEEHRCDYVYERGMPLGGGTEAFTREALFKAAREARTPEDREHVTLYIKGHPDIFRIGHPPVPRSLHRPDLRITVDYPEDLAFIRRFYRLHYQGVPLRLPDIVAELSEMKKAGADRRE